MYKITYSDITHGTVTFTRYGADVVQDHISHQDSYQPKPGVEGQLQRLADLVGTISDKMGINLLEIIDQYNLQEKYTYVKDGEE